MLETKSNGTIPTAEYEKFFYKLKEELSNLLQHGLKVEGIL